MSNKSCLCCHSNTIVDLQNSKASLILMENLKCHSFAILRNHCLPLNLLEEIYQEWDVFFSSSSKFNYLRDEYIDEGYVPVNTEVAKESIHPDFKEFYETHYNGKFPDNINILFTKNLMECYVKLSEKLMELINEQLPSFIKEKMMMSLPEMICGGHNHMLRVIHYPPIDKYYEIERAAPHGDACLFTILPVASCRGLEFLNKNGYWHEPELDKCDVVFFNSDMIELCTDFYLKSAKHRVNHNYKSSLESRFSIPFFVHPKRNVILSKNLTAYLFLQNRLSEIGYDGKKLINSDIERDK